MKTKVIAQATKKLLSKEYTFIIAEIGKNFIQTEEEKSVAEYHWPRQRFFV